MDTVVLHNHTEVNKTDVLKVCNGKGRTHKYREKAEAVVDSVLSLRLPGQTVPEQESEQAFSCSVSVEASTSDHALRAGPPSVNWLNGFPPHGCGSATKLCYAWSSSLPNVCFLYVPCLPRSFSRVLS